jgi:hypothetical protein
LCKEPRLKPRNVEYSVEEDVPGIWRWIILSQAGPTVVGDAVHRSREAAVSACIEEINNGLERSRHAPRP